MRAPSHSRKTSSARLGIDEFGIAAQTNKPFAKRVLYSRMDVLVAACLSELTQEFDAAWDALAAAHAGDPGGQLLAWLHHVADFKENEAERGCALANAAVELPGPGSSGAAGHPRV